MSGCAARRTSRCSTACWSSINHLGYEQPLGEHLKYLVKTSGQAIACLAWQNAPRHLKVRSRFLGWTDEARQRNVHLLAYNTRFLILPWVRVDHLASHILGRMAQLVPQVPGDSATMKRPRVDVNLKELDQIIERGTQAPLSESGPGRLLRQAGSRSRQVPQITN